MNRTAPSPAEAPGQAIVCRKARRQLRALLAALSSAFPADEVEDATEEAMPWFALISESQESVCFTWNGATVTATLYSGLEIAHWSCDLLDTSRVLGWYEALSPAIEAWQRSGGEADSFAHLTY